jgi:hypothetical protein
MCLIPVYDRTISLIADSVCKTPGATTVGNYLPACYLYAIQIRYDFRGNS